MLRWMLLVTGLIVGPVLVGRGENTDPRLKGYRVAPGYKVAIAATEPLVINPVAMTFGDDGRLFVIEWVSGDGPNDHIKVLTDSDGDGVFDKSSIYMDNLELPAGLLFWDGWTYITLNHDVVRFKDADGDGKFELRESIATGFGNDNSHHRVSGLTMGPDGWIYMTTGDSDAHAKGSDGSTATVLRCGGVFRCKPDGSQMENVAFGMRNPFGNIAFDDEFNIFHTDNDNEGSPGFTGCRILHVVEGGDYGWRLREGARCCQPDFERATWNGGRPGRLGWVAETGRGAPAGLCILNSAAFPPSTRNLLVYPDVFRKSVRAYKLKPAGATYTVDKVFELLVSDDGLFRPDDAEIGPDGALYILDWRTDSGGAGKLSGNGQFGRIYRLTWKGTKEEPARATLPRDRFTKLLKSDDDILVSALGDSDYQYRRLATLELIRRSSNVDHLKPSAVWNLRRMITGLPPFGIAGLHALEVMMNNGDKLKFSLLADYIGRHKPQAHRLAFELLNRIRSPEEPELFISLLLCDWVDPQSLRAKAIAMGGLTFLPIGALHPESRKLPVEDFKKQGLAIETEWRNRSRTDMADIPNTDQARKDQIKSETLARNKRQSDFARLITQELVAELLLDDAEKYSQGDPNLRDGLPRSLERIGKPDVNVEKYSQGDPFLRDGFTRGLERLGKPGLDVLIAAIKSGDKKKAAVALYALQGWRTLDGLNALLAEATGTDPIPAEARVGLFKALREFGPAVHAEPLIEWLVNAPKADPSARAEAIRVLGALQRRVPFAIAKILPMLLADPDTTVRRAALALAREHRSDAVKTSLVEIVSSPDRAADERSLAVVALRGYEAKELTPLYLKIFDASNDILLKGEILRTIAAGDFPAAAKKAEKLLGETDLSLRTVAIFILGQKPETALIVAQRFNEGKLHSEDLARVLEAIRSHATPEIQAATQTMLKSKLLAAPTGEEANKLRDYVGRRGNAGRGKAIYLDSKKGGCAACHKLEGTGVAIGPDLTKVFETLTFDKRVESILEPSKEIKEGYNTFKVATTDGRTLSGLLLSDGPQGVTLRDAQGKEIKIPVNEIDLKGPDKVSLMPAGVVGHLSFDELADLLAFLGDKQAQESLRTGK